jgi:aspartyl-tRNA(Asn)/glutamyl-tRNA(Gln) amidotransferase subunit B
MEKGQMRCDVNVSLRPKGQEKFGTKIELKNLNSVSAVRRALHYEIDRQAGELEAGNRIVQATWRWNDDAGQTEWMRNKEDSQDYRYFPDPDLLPVRTAEMLAALQVPELPHEKQARFVRDFGVTSYDGSVLSADRALASYFEEAANGTPFGKKVANWVINNLLSALKEAELGIEQSPVRPAQLRDLVQLIEDGKLTNNQAKEVFARVFAEPGHEDLAALSVEMGFEPADAGAVEQFVDQVIAANPGPAAEVRGGNAKAINALLGQVMKLASGKGDPKVIRQLLEQKLSGS